MSALQYVHYILDTNWEPAVTGRDYDVPKPTIDLRQDQSQISLRGQDHINITDGGDEIHEPASLQYQEETVESFVTITIRTTHKPPSPPNVDRPGNVRFEGKRDANNEAESYGGLRGEVKRILELDTHRLGDQEFDLIEASVWRDEAGQTGKNHYRGAWEVQLDQRARSINPPVP